MNFSAPWLAAGAVLVKSLATTTAIRFIVGQSSAGAPSLSNQNFAASKAVAVEIYNDAGTAKARILSHNGAAASAPGTTVSLGAIIRVLQCAEAAHHLAAIMRNAHEWLWRLPTDRLLAILNADVEVTLATFSQNTALGLAENAALDAMSLPEFPNRSPVEVGRDDITFDGEAFVLLPPHEAPIPAPLAD